MANKLDYYNGENEVPEGTVRISASSIARFFTHTRQYWGELMLDEDGFTGSTSSVLGTVVHFIAEQYAKKQTLTAEDKQEIENYITQETAKDPDIDGNIIRTQYKIMAQNLVNEYLIHNMPTEVEPFVVEEVLPNIMVGGSIDNITGSTIVDYKTSSLKKLPDTIKFEYRLQLLTYAWVMRKKGTPIDRIRIVYVSRDQPGAISEKTGKQLKSYPSEVKVLTESIFEEDFEYIESIITLIAESIQAWQTTPNIRHLLCHDMRVKQC